MTWTARRSTTSTPGLPKPICPGCPRGVDLEVEIRVGKGLQLKILEFAEEKDVDLIIIGRHGRSSIGKVLFGKRHGEDHAPCGVCPCLSFH